MTQPILRHPQAALSTWLTRWGPILPLLAAELIIWLGFGALLPVMPLYFTEHGVGIEALGIVIAAWPAARLIGEPIFGWVADRTKRPPLMVAGLVLTSVALALPLALTGPFEFLVLRAFAGLATSIYDPAARGFLTDGTPPERRGEAFGLYGAAQMAGLLLGPAIGGIGAAAFGGITFVFAFGAASTLVAAFAVGLAVRETAQKPGMASRRRHATGLSYDTTDFPSEPPLVHRRAADEALADDALEIDETQAAGSARRAASLWNRLLLAAICLNAGGYFAGGIYEVIWSLFLQGKGASVDFIGLTFAWFALPVLVLSPFAGRLVDRRGTYWFVVAGSLGPIIAAPLYTLITDPLQSIPLLFLESTGFAIVNPALFSVVAAGSPRGKSSTAQGLFGASGTIGTIIASVVTGYLASLDIRYPFLVGALVMLIALVAGLAVGGRALRGLGLNGDLASGRVGASTAGSSAGPG
jgi:DHA1 family multidrug resistance protein-like MFS transporter